MTCESDLVVGSITRDLLSLRNSIHATPCNLFLVKTQKHAPVGITAIMDNDPIAA